MMNRDMRVFMVLRPIPFPTGSDYIYIYILVSQVRLCVVYVVKKVARSINGRGM